MFLVLSTVLVALPKDSSTVIHFGYYRVLYSRYYPCVIAVNSMFIDWLIDCLIDYLVCYAVSAVFRPYNGGDY